LSTSAAMGERFNSTTEFFSDQASVFAARYSSNPCFRDRLGLFVQGIQQAIPVPAKVLDFGCGPGVISLSLGRLGYEVIGLDGSSGMVELARAQLAWAKLPLVRFEQSDAERFDPSFGLFDAVVCSSVLEYIQDDIGLLGKLVRCLRPNGYLLISVPHTPNLLTPLDGLMRLTKVHLLRKRSRHLPYIRHSYKRERFLQTAQGMGLGDLKCTAFEFPLFGELGIRFSRYRFVGRMLLIEGRKLPTRSEDTAKGTCTRD